MPQSDPDLLARRIAALNPRVAMANAGEAPGTAPIAAEQPPSASGTRDRADFALFVDRNPDKFLAVFDAQAKVRRGQSVCWPGLLVPQAWFLYRKMYGLAALACALPVVVNSLHPGMGIERALAWVPPALGLAGRGLYVAGARKTIAKIRARAVSESEARESIRRAGGVSTPGAVVGGLIAAGAAAILLFGVHAKP